jgi:hypothetical protein
LGPGHPTALTTDWRSPWKNPDLRKPLVVTMLALTPGSMVEPIDYGFTQVTQAVTITRIMCWPTPTTCAPV